MREKIMGIVGGSGLYELEGLTAIKEVELTTPFGKPSGVYLTGRLGDVSLVFLPRHGVGHKIAPHEINYRANIYGFKKLGVQQLLSFSAVGSMKEEIKPGEVVVVDQFVDRTRTRPSSFFENGCVAHVSFADPVCPALRKILVQSGEICGIKIHDGGTYVCIEGPQFSTRAESLLYKSWDIDVIGMTNLPEARLAREAELCYGTAALVTDFDCWRTHDSSVDARDVLSVMRHNINRAKDMIKEVISHIAFIQSCSCSSALKHAVVTQNEVMSQEARQKLSLFLNKYQGVLS